MCRRILHVASWLLSRLAPESARESIIGDLTEEYALRANATSSSVALRWYLRQVCASVPPVLWSRLTKAAWISTFAVALLAYIAVGVVESVVNWAISNRTVTGTFAYKSIGLIITFPMVVLIGYLAARFRRRAAIVLGLMMLFVVTVMMLCVTENMPTWYRIAYFFGGPSAALIGSALRSLRPAPS
jgi:hypothetical protein